MVRCSLPATCASPTPRLPHPAVQLLLHPCAPPPSAAHLVSVAAQAVQPRLPRNVPHHDVGVLGTAGQQRAVAREAQRRHLHSKNGAPRMAGSVSVGSQC